MRRVFLLPLLLCAAAVIAHAQPHRLPAVSTPASALPSAPTPQQDAIPPDDRQPRRVLGIPLMSNYGTLRVGMRVPPPTVKESFDAATNSTFNYSSFALTGFTSIFSEGIDSHPQLGKGVAGFGRYYWRGFVTKADGNYWVMFILPSAFHEDERYYALDHGSFFHRSLYAASRVLIAPNYHGQNTINGAELLGRGIAAGISTAYYPAEDRTFGEFAGRYGYDLLGDAATNVLRELWPDIAVHVLHQHS